MVPFWCAAAIAPEDVTALFPAANTPGTIPFRAEASGAKAARAEGFRTFRITDYRGAVVAQGRVAVGADGLLQVPLNLPAGYYETGFDGEAQATGLWIRPDDGRGIPDDPFFSIDAALSLLTKREARDGMIRNLPQVIGTGGMARERMAWQSIHPADDRWDWETSMFHESTRAAYRKAGIPVLEVFHRTPERWGAAQGGRFPADLLAASRSWREVATRLHPYWGALEIWNEPDIGFGGHQPADQYPPLLKALRYAMREAGVDTPIGGGVFATSNRNYITLAARNGLLDECDFVSFHYYGDPLGLERLVARHRLWLAEFGYPGKPLWLTEAGLTWRGKTGERPDADVQARNALVYAMQSVEARACGIARYFPFVYPEYSERSGSRHYGMLDARGTPLRTLAATAQVAHALSGTAYLGDLPLENIRGAKRLRVFSHPGREDAVIVVAYTGDVDAGRSLGFPYAVIAARGVDGRMLATGQAGGVPAPDGIVYLEVEREAVMRDLIRDTEAMRLYTLAREGSPPPPPPSPIVLQPEVDVSSLPAKSTLGYFLPSDASRFGLKVNVYNLGGEARNVRIQGGLSDQTVRVEGNAKATVDVEADVDVLSHGFAETKLLTITGSSDGGERVAPVALALNLSTGMDIGEHLKESRYQFLLSLDEDYRWKKNASGRMKIGSGTTGAWGFTVEFPAGVDRWAYPEFTLPQEADTGRMTGILLRARAMNPGTVRIKTWDAQGMTSFTPFSVFPADGKWHVVYVSLASYQQADEGKPVRISVGINSATETNAIEISDLYLIGK